MTLSVLMTGGGTTGSHVDANMAAVNVTHDNRPMNLAVPF
jgi:hypothetical protein